MKKILILFFIFIFCLNFPVCAKQEKIKDDNGKIIEGEVIELKDVDETTILEQETKKETLKAKLSEYYTIDNHLLTLHYKDYVRFDYGAIGTMTWNVASQDELHSNFKFNSIDLMLSGKANKYISYKAQVLPHRNIDEQTILGDVWVKGEYKNYALQLGRMRRPFSYEASHSPYDIDFASHSQIAKLFGDDRDTGGKISAKYKYADIDMGLFASMQNRPFEFNNRGIEYDTTLTLKPLAKWNDKGDLRLSGSIGTGKRDYSYTNYAGSVSYKYKKFGLRTEYIWKEPAFYGEKKANGFYVDGTYFLTDKLQALLRFDSYNPDVTNSDRRTNEYVAGLNYYLNNRNTMFVLNYAYTDGSVNSHRIALQMRYKTW